MKIVPKNQLAHAETTQNMYLIQFSSYSNFVKFQISNLLLSIYYT